VVRQRVRRRVRPVREYGVPALSQNRGFATAGLADSGELFRRPGGTTCRGTKGEMEGRQGLLIGVVGEPFLLRINERE
jgi:hypothetical protein